MSGMCVESPRAPATRPTNNSFHRQHPPQNNCVESNDDEYFKSSSPQPALEKRSSSKGTVRIGEGPFRVRMQVLQRGTVWRSRNLTPGEIYLQRNHPLLNSRERLKAARSKSARFSTEALRSSDVSAEIVRPLPIKKAYDFNSEADRSNSPEQHDPDRMNVDLVISSLEDDLTSTGRQQPTSQTPSIRPKTTKERATFLRGAQHTNRPKARRTKSCIVKEKAEGRQRLPVKPVDLFIADSLDTTNHKSGSPLLGRRELTFSAPPKLRSGNQAEKRVTSAYPIGVTSLHQRHSLRDSAESTPRIISPRQKSEALVPRQALEMLAKKYSSKLKTNGWVEADRSTSSGASLQDKPTEGSSRDLEPTKATRSSTDMSLHQIRLSRAGRSACRIEACDQSHWERCLELKAQTSTTHILNNVLKRSKTTDTKDLTEVKSVQTLTVLIPGVETNSS